MISRRIAVAVVLLTVGLSLATVLWADDKKTKPSEYGFDHIPPQISEADRKIAPDTWALEFHPRSVRYVNVNTPGKGTTLVWYMTYEIVNRTGAPRNFIPQFTLVTDKGKEIPDQILPRAQQAVRDREDPTTVLLNSVTITSPIPPTPKESTPIVRRGVACWEDPEADGSIKSFSIFVYGLSNAYTKVDDPKTKQPIIKRKVVKLDFTKPGDTVFRNEKEIRYAGHAWTYR